MAVHRLVLTFLYSVNTGEASFHTKLVPLTFYVPSSSLKASIELLRQSPHLSVGIVYFDFDFTSLSLIPAP